MLQIIYPRGDTQILAPCWSSSDDALTVGGVTQKYQLSLGFVLSSSSMDSVSIDGMISTGESNYLPGENDCTHKNIMGCLYSASDLTVPGGTKYMAGSPTVTYTPPMTMLSSPNNVAQFTHLLPVNTNFEVSQSFPYVNRGRILGTRTQLAVSFVSAGVDFVGYASSNDRYPGCSIMWFAIEHDPIRGDRYCAGSLPRIENLYLDNTTEFISILKSKLDVSINRPTGPYVKTWGFPVYFLSGTPVLEKNVLSKIVFDNYDALVPTSNKIDFGELAYNCAKQVQPWSNNGLALSKDLLNLKKEIGSLVKLAANIDDPKTWASLYLSKRYGLSLTLADLKSLFSSLKKQQARKGPNKVSSSATLFDNKCSYEYHYSIYYEEYANAFADLYYGLAQFDLLPDLSNVWDLVPFTFVVDWVVDVGGVLDRIDALDRLSAYNIVGDMHSVKTIRPITADMLGLPGLSGAIDIVYYRRWTSGSCEKPSIKLDVPLSNGFDHFIEAGALTVQKILN